MKKLIALLSLKGKTKEQGQTPKQHKALDEAYLKEGLGLTDEELKELEQEARDQEAH